MALFGRNLRETVGHHREQALAAGSTIVAREKWNPSIRDLVDLRWEAKPYSQYQIMVDDSRALTVQSLQATAPQDSSDPAARELMPHTPTLDMKGRGKRVPANSGIK